MDIKPPNITGNTTEAKIAQIKEYLFMLTVELNYKLSNINKELEERRK